MSGSNGRLGDGRVTSSTVAVPVAGISTAVDLSVGATHSCAVLKDGRAVCWGKGGRQPLR